MVGQDDTLDLRVVQVRQVRVLVRLDALEHDRQIRVLRQPRQRELPREIGRRAPEKLCTDAAAAWFGGCASLRGGCNREVCGYVLRSLVVLSFAWHRRVEREADEFDFGGERVDTAEHDFALFRINLGVQLPAEHLANGCIGNDLFGSHGRVVGDQLHGTEFRTGLSNALFAGGMGQTRHGGGRDVDGSADAMAKEAGRGVAFFTVYENTRAEENRRVCFVVQPFRLQVVGGGEVVGPRFFADLLRSYFFDLVEVEEAFQGWRSLLFFKMCFFLGSFVFGKGIRFYGAKFC